MDKLNMSVFSIVGGDLPVPDFSGDLSSSGKIISWLMKKGIDFSIYNIGDSIHVSLTDHSKSVSVLDKDIPMALSRAVHYLFDDSFDEGSTSFEGVRMERTALL